MHIQFLENYKILLCNIHSKKHNKQTFSFICRRQSTFWPRTEPLRQQKHTAWEISSLTHYGMNAMITTILKMLLAT